MFVGMQESFFLRDLLVLFMFCQEMFIDLLDSLNPSVEDSYLVYVLTRTSSTQVGCKTSLHLVSQGHVIKMRGSTSEDDIQGFHLLGAVEKEIAFFMSTPKGSPHMSSTHALLSHRA